MADFNKIQLINVTPEQLVQLITESVKGEIQEQFNNHKPQKEQSEYVTIDEACKILNVTKPTLWAYTKKGVLTKYSVGKGRKYYKRSDIMDAFQISEDDE